MISIIPIISVLFALTLAQYDYQDEEGRRLHRRKRPNYGGGSGPCGGRNVNGDGRFLSLQYINVNYEYNCGGGGGYHPQQDFTGSGAGGGPGQHKPHKPHGNGGLFGGLFGVGGQQSDPVQQNYGSGGGGGHFNKPIFQRPPFGGNSGNGGLFSNLFDGSVINSFSSLFSNANINPSNAVSDFISNVNPSNALMSVTNLFNRPSNPSQSSTSTDSIQYIQDLNNNNNNNVVNNNNNNNIVDEKPVHEEQDPVPEAYNNLRPGQYISASSPFGSFVQPYSGFGNINYNKAIRKVNRQVNKVFNQLFRR